MKKLACFLILVLGLVSAGYAMDSLLIGNFEDPISSDRYDNWMSDPVDTPVTQPSAAVTLGGKALQLDDADGGDGATFSKPFGEYGNTVEGNIYYQALLNPGAVLAFDVTAIAGQVADGWASIRPFWNSAGGWGQDYGQEQALTVDGQPHTYLFNMSADAVTALQNSIGEWGYNLGFILNTGAGSTTIYVDNIWLYPEGPVADLFPHSPLVDPVADMVNLVTNVTLSWKAADDPNRATANNVHPDIVDQYVFMSTATDPNLFYVGATGVDPGIENPDSSYGPINNLPFETTYYWAVVEAMSGYTQALTPGVSTIGDVDPNNIIGPTWHFVTLSTSPQIIAQPVSTRGQLGQPLSPAFTITVSSVTPESYQWYASADALIDDSDVALSAGITNVLSFNSLTTGAQKYYYCRVTNSSATPVDSDVVNLVVERKVAEYLFEGNLNDTSGSAQNGTAVNGAVTAAGDSVQGTSALVLNGTNQYVTLPINGFPRAYLTGANGIGGGLDIGSIICWVKATKNGAVLANHNDAAATGFQLTVADDIGMLVRRETGTASSVAKAQAIVGDGNWHLIAATWQLGSGGQMRIYVDNAEVTSVASTGAPSFAAWTRNILLGANRANEADRTVIGSYFGGKIDNLRVYNYVLTAETIALEYYNVTGKQTCLNTAFEGSGFNVDNTGSSYCRVDIADFAQMAESWLANGFYPAF
ncbi:MAG: hypothetical protein LLF76_00120 [Planctomycetaceae bacterium]|nr:hypothetical protein [Planctomycetaceae bacterium]